MPPLVAPRSLVSWLFLTLAAACPPSAAAAEAPLLLKAPVAPEDQPLLRHADEAPALAPLDPARRKMAEQLAQVMQLSRTLRTEAELGYAVILHPLRLFVEREMDDDLTRLMQPFFIETRRTLSEGVYWNVVLERCIDAYARTFDETELAAITTFYSSPVGQRLAAASPELHRQSTELVKVSLRDASDQVRVDFGRALARARAALLDERREKIGIAPGRPLPAFRVPLLDGRAFDSTTLRGRVVLLQSWATNIRDWEQDLAVLRGLHERFQARGLEIIGVNLDLDDAGEVAARARYLELNPMPWPNLVGGHGEGADVVSALTLFRPGTRLLVGRDGKLIAIEPGLDEVPALVERALAASDAAAASPPSR